MENFVVRSHKIRIYPNQEQETLLKKTCGVSRHTYNKCLGRIKWELGQGKKPKLLEIKKVLNSIKATEYPFMLEVTKCAPEGAIQDLGKALSNFFSKRSKFPKFKSKRGKNTFRVDNEKLKVVGNYVKLPKIEGNIRMAEFLRFNGKILTSNVSGQAGKWWISISVEIPDVVRPADENQAVGIDLGIKTAIVCSDGKTYEMPTSIKTFRKKTERANRILSRKVIGSNNWNKQVVRIQNLYWRSSNLKSDFLNKATSDISKRYSLVFMEDLNVKGMMKNHKLARAISEVGFGEIRSKLSYKTNVVLVDRFFPSSKTCSRCGHVKSELSLSERTYVCEVCGLVIDRDLNASYNIHTVGLTEFKACGPGSSGQVVSRQSGETTGDESGNKGRAIAHNL